MTGFIKAYSFTDYIDKDWYTWKFTNLLEALHKSWRILEAKQASSYAYGKNVSKAPVLRDETDMKFLYQFPVFLWSQALRWRYNEGMLLASEEREKDPEHSLDAVNNWIDLIDLQGMRGQEGARAGTYRFQGTQKSPGVWTGVWTGLHDLLEKLERPDKSKPENNINPSYPKAMAPIDKDAVALSQIHPRDFDPNSPTFRGNYKMGRHNLDFSKPHRLTPEDIDEIPPEEISVDGRTGMTAEQEAAAVAERRARMKKNALHTFRGAGVMQKDVAEDQIIKWIKGTALGLLGEVPNQIEDPNHPGQMLQVNRVHAKQMNSKWHSNIGRDDIDADTLQKLVPGAIGYQKDAVKYPVVSKQITYTLTTNKGTEPPVTQTFALPVLNPGKIIPTLPPLTDAQKEIILLRREAKGGKSGRNKADKVWDKITPTGKRGSARAVQIGDFENLITMMDILTPDQIKYLTDNQRDDLDWVHTHKNHSDDYFVRQATPQGAEDRSSGYYTVGHHPNKGRREISPKNMSDEQFAVAVKRYQQQIQDEVTTTITKFMELVHSPKNPMKLPPVLVTLYDKISIPLMDVATALNLLNLNDDRMGIYDPEVGLTQYGASDKKDGEIINDPNLATARRKTMIKNLLKDMSQIEFGDIASRRSREQGRLGLPGESPTDKEGQTYDPSKKASGGEGMSFYHNRQLTAPDPQEVARRSWFIPTTGQPLIDKIMTFQREIQEGLGNKWSKKVTDLAGDVAAEVKEMNQLKAEAKQHLLASNPNLSKEELEEKAGKIAVDAYTKINAKTATGHIADIAATLGAADVEKATAETNKEKDEAMDQFYNELISNWGANFPAFIDGDYKPEGKHITLDFFARTNKQEVSPAQVLQKIEATWPGMGVAKFGIPLLMTLSDYKQTENNRASRGGLPKPFKANPLTEPEATEIVRKAGLGNPQQPQEPSVQKPQQPAVQQPKEPIPFKPELSKAATDMSALLQDLPANKNAIKARADEFADPVKFAAFEKAVEHLKTQMAKNTAAGIPNSKEIMTLASLSDIMKHKHKPKTPEDPLLADLSANVGKIKADPSYKSDPTKFTALKQAVEKIKEKISKDRAAGIEVSLKDIMALIALGKMIQ